MRILLVSDIHGNLPALEAVLFQSRKHSPEKIISLGDQVNLGPDSSEVLSLLRCRNAVCLRGNHERYVLSVMNGDEKYSGANFASLHFNAEKLTREEISLPSVYESEGIIFTHALPDDDRFPVHIPSEAIPLLCGKNLSGVRILCGHGHNPTHIRFGSVTIDSIGSTGCMDDGIPGTAPYTILETFPDGFTLRPYLTVYDTSILPQRFVSSGMADYCPIMSHICCLQMMTNQDILNPFVALARKLSDEKKEKQVSREVWENTDRLFPWPDGIASDTFWENCRL